MSLDTANLSLQQAASSPVDAVLDRLGASSRGLTEAEAAMRLALQGPNAIRVHRVRFWSLIWSQLKSPLLLLLAVTAAVSAFLGQAPDAIIIGIILLASVGLGFVNEYRAAKAAQELRAQLQHRVTVIRDGHARELDVTQLVRGDVVELEPGAIVPADLRLMWTEDLECDEAVLTGESVPVAKHAEPVAIDAQLAELGCCALMGTVVRAGRCAGVVVVTGKSTELGRIAAGLSESEPETEFQKGLRKFSLLLVIVAAVLTTAIFIINIALHRPILEAVLFSLAIAVGISPQLLPAVVSTSLASGSRALSKQKVLVKRMVVIEDLGDIEVLFTDKTGTLTEGRIDFMRALAAEGAHTADVITLGLVCNAAVVENGIAISGSVLDVALWASPVSAAHAEQRAGWAVLAEQPFDHVTRTASVIARSPQGASLLVVKGAPESVLERCANADPALVARIDDEFRAGNRVVAVATRGMAGTGEHDFSGGALTLVGVLVFLDPPRPEAKAAIERLETLGIDVKVVTGDNATVAEHVCADLGLAGGRTLTGRDLDAMDDAALAAALPGTRIFARVSPEQKARVIRLARGSGLASAYLGDGVNDAVALHAADIGISVDSATDIAKDAADVILLEKDLGVLAEGVVIGRRVFANTIKYVLMGTSSNFGNMFSAAGASAFLPFLPMLPSQILLNNLMYDSSQLAIPTDHVDDDQLKRPSHWDIRMIRRFMLFFGPISSAFDFLTFGILMWVLHASETEFHGGWFVESLATQTLVIFVIRTRRVPFLRSHASKPLTFAVLAVVLIGALLPLSPLAGILGFTPLPWGFYAILGLMVAAYLVIVDVAKGWFFRRFA